MSYGTSSLHCPFGHFRVHVNVPFLDAIWAAAHRPRPHPDDEDYEEANEEGEGAGKKRCGIPDIASARSLLISQSVTPLI